MKEDEIRVADLSLIPTDDLLIEIMNRFDPVVFIGTKYNNGSLENGTFTYTRWRGAIESCIGLCNEMEATLFRSMIREDLGHGQDDQPS